MPLAMKWTSEVSPCVQWILSSAVGVFEVSWMLRLWRTVVKKMSVEGESGWGLQSHHRRSAAGTVPKPSLSIAFPHKLFRCFQWASNFMYKSKWDHFFRDFLKLPHKLCISLLRKLERQLSSMMRPSPLCPSFLSALMWPQKPVWEEHTVSVVGCSDPCT